MRSLHRVLVASAVVAAGLSATSVPAAAGGLTVSMGCYPGVNGPGTFRCEAVASQQFVSYFWFGTQNATILRPKHGRIVNGQCTPGLVSEVTVAVATPQEEASATDTFTCP
jgi:hypothetical protein